MSETLRALDQGGAFDDYLNGYQPRPQQMAMAEAVERALANDDVLIVEAGTGVGKTFAYLTPAILSQGKIIVSTGTKALQDQLFDKDLPTVLRALGADHQVSVLKGRANYLCLHRMKQTQANGYLTQREHITQLQAIRAWSTVTQVGDIGECASVPEDSLLWPRVTSTADNCIGQECPDYSDCFVMKARRSAQEADLVVINHYLFFADLSLKEEGFAELLPSANAIILDEAHQLPEVAGQFFGVTLSGRQLIELSKDLIAEYLNESRDIDDLQDVAESIAKAVADFRLALGTEIARQAWLPLLDKTEVLDAYQELLDVLHDSIVLLEPVADRNKGLESCHKRALTAHNALHYLGERQSDYVLWCETFQRSFSLHATPLDVRDLFRQQVGRHLCSWVLTSATLTVDDSFAHYAQRLGLEEAETLKQDSPFDYQHNARLYLPEGLPQPSHPQFTRSIVDKALPLIRAAQGRCFMLFTSYRAMNEAADYLDGQIDYPVLVQGEQPKAQLLKAFREHGNAVLLGTSSFWEGVDVRGDALSLVIIDKLPFASPSDPVLEARLAALQEAGQNPFMQYQVPQAVVSLRQGSGRLIRDVTDRGVLMLCDPRLTTKFYGKIFLRSLPSMPRCADEAEAVEFLSEL